MYCPGCGVNNSAETKFCTRCGTNLSVVSDALSGRATSSLQLDERAAKLMRDYYKGRRDVISGLVLIPAAAAAIAVLVRFGMPPVASFFIVCWMLFWGVSALAVGFGKWIASSGEMRALGIAASPSRMRPPVQHAALTEHNQQALTQPELLTDPKASPSSVTEHTTRQLEEDGYPPGLNDKAAQSE